MQASHATTDLSSLDKALREFRTFVAEHAVDAASDFELFETQLAAQLAVLGREAIASGLRAADPSERVLEIAGVEYRRALTQPAEYMTSCGTVSVPRGLYRAVRNGPTVCPLERRVGTIGFWTPKAARVAALAVAMGSPRQVEKLFAEATLMRPSRSTLDRLPKVLNEVWESGREQFEAEVRRSEAVPADAAVVAFMLDGVLVHMRGGNGKAKKEATFEKGQEAKGPAGYQEVGCASVSFYDTDGVRLATRRMARMPEADKATLKSMLAIEASDVLKQRPDLRVVKVADGAPNNWTFLESLPGDDNVVDYYHATQHLARALDGLLGANSKERRLEYERLCSALLEQEDGVHVVIDRLTYLAKKRRKRVNRSGVRYFQRHAERMRYAQARAAGLPIGSGVMEGTCRTIVTDRLKCAGMRWSTAGGQGILTLRSAVQSDRFDAYWNIIARQHRAA